MHAHHGACARSPRRPHPSPPRYEAGELARSIARAYKDVVLRPYRGAQAQGALGFGKGLLSFGLGFLAMPVRPRLPLMACAHPLIWQAWLSLCIPPKFDKLRSNLIWQVVLSLGGFSFGLATAASHAERRRERLKHRNHASSGPNAVMSASQPLRRPREFGTHGQIQPARVPDEQQRAEAEAASVLQRAWRQRTLRRGSLANPSTTADGGANSADGGANSAANGLHRALTASRAFDMYVSHALHQHQARHARDAASVLSQRRRVGLGTAAAFGFGIGWRTASVDRSSNSKAKAKAAGGKVIEVRV